eukprot:scaffold2447_cov110-Cylindrotheca_fusiformis.AAC.12
MTTTLLGGQWSCTACTFVNDSNSKNNNNEARNKSSLSCAMCGAAPRPAAATVQDEKKKQKKKQTKQQTLSFAIGTKRQPAPNKPSKSAASSTTTKTTKTTSNKHHSSFSKYVRTTIPRTSHTNGRTRQTIPIGRIGDGWWKVLMLSITGMFIGWNYHCHFTIDCTHARSSDGIKGET